MNTDDFEKQLQQLPLRQPPAAWREEILAAAQADVRRAALRDESGLLAGWRAFLSRIPVAWGAVAAMWLIIIGANSLMSGPSISVAASAPASRAAITAWSAQRIQASLFANGPVDFPEVVPLRETPVAPPRPRSERRPTDGLGEMETLSNRLTLA